VTVLTLINPHSGGVSRLGPEAVSRAVSRAVAAAGRPTMTVFGDALILKDRAARAVRDGDVELVVAVGGDGTLAAVAQSLAGSTIPLAPLPGGTVNALASDLGYPADLAAACERALAGSVRRIDVAYIGDRVFMNNVVFGAYSDMADAREDFREAETLSHTLEAAAQMVQAFAGAQPQNFAVQSDGTTVRVRSASLMVSNNIYTGAELLRPNRARLDEGVLGLYLMQSIDGAQVAARLVEALTGQLETSDAIQIRRCGACRVQTDSRVQTVSVDGENMQLGDEVEFRIRPKHLAVLAPQASP